MQSSEVDLQAKSEILDGGAVVCDAAGVTFLGSDSRGVLGLAPPENFEKLKQLRRVFLHSEQKCDALKATVQIPDFPFYWTNVNLCDGTDQRNACSAQEYKVF